MASIWFTSDTHWNHRNIVRGTTAWKEFEPGSSHQHLRDFDTLEAHNQALIDNFNSVVKHDDILWHLGDWSFGGHESIKKFRDQLHCRNINLVFGNHDQHIEPIDSPYRQLFSSVQYYKELAYKIDSARSGRYGRTKMVLSHFAFRVWNQSHHGTIHLYGHSHGSLPGLGRSMDVGVDTNNLYPYHLDEIVDRFRKVEPHIVDHHNKNTN